MSMAVRFYLTINGTRSPSSFAQRPCTLVCLLQLSKENLYIYVFALIWQLTHCLQVYVLWPTLSLSLSTLLESTYRPWFGTGL